MTDTSAPRDAAQPRPRPGRTARPLLRLLRLARPLRGRLVLAAAAGALATGCAVALLATSGWLIARASQHPSIVALSVAVVAVRAFVVGRGVFRYGERLASHDVAFRVLSRVRVAIWRRLEALAPAGLPAFSSGDLLARLVSDVDSTQDLFIRGITPPVAAALVGAGAALACLLILRQAGMLLAAGLLVAGILVPLAAVGAARSASRHTAAARGRFSAAVTDLLAGAADLHAFGATEVALARAEHANARLSKLGRRSATASGAGAGLSALAAGLTLWAVLLAGVAAVGSGTINRVPLAVVTLTALAAFEAVSPLPAAAMQLAQSRAAACRIAEVMDATDPVIEPPSPRALPTGAVTAGLRDASLRYEPGAPLAIDGVTLELAPGRRVALVGPNGAGKSTVAAVLLRFRDLDGGSATLCGHDLGDYRADDIRTIIGGCPQDPHLFDSSIGENLALACPSASRERLGATAAHVGLGAWIASLPDGLDTPVGPNGTAISGGQRQRIVLARALLADPAVLVLDEPTAHLDAETRRSVMDDLLAATQGRSVLLITHEMEGLEHLDEIVVLDQGKAAERGTHRDLIAAGGLYARLWRTSDACQANPDAVR